MGMRKKNVALTRQLKYEPIVLETTVMYDESTERIMKDIGRRLMEDTGDNLES